MSFETYEESRYHGQPISLFQFSFGTLPEDRYCYTDAETVQVHNGDTYIPMAVERDEIESNGSLDNTTLTISMQVKNKLGESFRQWPPSYVMSLLIWAGHANDPDHQFNVIWSGKVINCAWQKSEAQFTCEPVSTSLKRPGLRRNYQRSCPHALYGPQCRAEKKASDRSVAAVYRGSNVVSLTSPVAAAYVNGQAEYVTVEGRRQILTIIALDGQNVKFQGSPIGLVPGAPIKLYFGCDHTLGDLGCSLHQNWANYGGQPWIPFKNPTNSLTIYN